MNWWEDEPDKGDPAGCIMRVFAIVLPLLALAYAAARVAAYHAGR